MEHVELRLQAGLERRPIPAATPIYSLPISKLRGVPHRTRAQLKARRITTCAQLLAVAARPEDRARIAAEIGADTAVLDMLVERADMARVNGIGAVFGMMLEDLGIRDVATLASQDPADLHARLRAYNGEERIARRSPTPEEVTEWVTQARALPGLTPS